MNKKQSLTLEKRRARTGILFVLPGMIGFFVLTVLPLFITLWYSVTGADGQLVFLQNYLDTLQSDSFLLALKNTMLFSAAGIPLLLITSMLLALIFFSIGRDSNLHTGMLISVLLLPIVIPSSFSALFFQILLERSGILNTAAPFLGNIDWLRTQPWAFLILTLLFVWKNFGYVMIIDYAALTAIDPDILSAALCDGAGVFRRFFSVTLPMVAPSVFFTAVFGFMNVFKIYRESFLLMGEYPVSGVYLLQNFIQNNLANMNFQRMSCASILFLILMSIPVAIMLRQNNKRGSWL